MHHIAYITFDGVLEPLGRSQVTHLLMRLCDRYRFTLISFEKAHDLSNHARVSAQEREFEEAGISWVHHPYRTGARGIMSNLATASDTLMSVNSRDAVDFVHARSYLSGAVANAFRRLSGVPYLFDFRGYWVDERIDERLWFTNPTSIGVGRMVERALYQNAAGVVSLARPAAEDIVSGKFGKWDGRPVEVIPTCVDEDGFTLERRLKIPEAFAERLQDKSIVAFVGSLNRSYRVDQSLQLFRFIRERVPNAHLLGLTRQVDQLKTKAQQAGISEADMTITTANHQDMPAWLTWMDWGLLLLNEPSTKRGSMPTKLGEFFAAGVRPLQYGCNEEVSDWVVRSGSGLVLAGTSESDLKAAADFVAGDVYNRGAMAQARKITMEHFSMRSAAQRYDHLYQRLI